MRCGSLTITSRSFRSGFSFSSAQVSIIIADHCPAAVAKRLLAKDLLQEFFLVLIGSFHGNVNP